MMNCKTHDLSRFTQMHKRDYQTALAEIRAGRKTTHWMWYIFPQIHSLGTSPPAVFYAIQSLEEAEAFLNDPYLGGHLLEIGNALLALPTNDALAVFGSPDNMKLKSSMTLFALCAKDDNAVFQKVLDKFFGGKQDQRTLRILGL